MPDELLIAISDKRNIDNWTKIVVNTELIEEDKITLAPGVKPITSDNHCCTTESIENTDCNEHTEHTEYSDNKDTDKRDTDKRDIDNWTKIVVNTEFTEEDKTTLTPAAKSITSDNYCSTTEQIENTEHIEHKEHKEHTGYADNKDTGTRITE